MYLIKQAGKYAKKGERRVFLLGAIGIRADGATVHAHNHSVKFPTPTAHAEIRLLKKLGMDAELVVVARIALNDGGYRMSKPCKNCDSALKNARVKKIVYSTGPNSFETMKLVNGEYI